jgi:hypothetical protein
VILTAERNPAVALDVEGVADTSLDRLIATGGKALVTRWKPVVGWVGGLGHVRSGGFIGEAHFSGAM